MFRKNNHSFLLLMPIVTIILLLSACDGRTVYHTYLPIPLEGWNKTDTLVFTVPIQDTVSTFHLSVEVRHREEYPYTNLFLFINNDTVEYTLADKKGNWKGIGISAIYQNKFPYRTIRIQHPDTIVFRISQGMADPLLHGIQDIGICMER